MLLPGLPSVREFILETRGDPPWRRAAKVIGVRQDDARQGQSDKTGTMQSFDNHHRVTRRDDAKTDREPYAARRIEALRLDTAYRPFECHDRLCHRRSP
jgi:hypothetical protein